MDYSLAGEGAVALVFKGNLVRLSPHDIAEHFSLNWGSGASKLEAKRYGSF